ncbi:nicotinate-nucleotide--dimethylbenzimidazole phosphoribosyltransferase [Bacillus sp. CGMCC 1.16607]|uniref:nicotinate-nucleotide--dimethylbenzimidazole phosphoribosyltransferase n=1 Tax=Bacillus sp. CGMCC 1.16607 TaxID=3351842 RepID=UPI0036258E77
MTGIKTHEWIQSIPKLSQSHIEETKKYVDGLTKPIGSLGKLEDIAGLLSGITLEKFPKVSPPGVLVFAGDHGVVEEGVSVYPKEVTAQMVYNFLNGGAAINVFARQIGAHFMIVDVGVACDLEHDQLVSRKVGCGTRNFLKEDAMTEEQARKAILVGMEAAGTMIDKGAKTLILGEMGIGNTTAASAIVSVITGCSVEQVVGSGTGISDESKLHKQQVIRNAILERQPNADDALDIVKKLGGFEIAAMAGAMLKGAELRIPIIIDGFICTAAALIACVFQSNVKEYLFASHLSKEQGHKEALQFLEKKPLFDLQLRLGEGTGAALAYPIIEAATRMLSEMATFESAGISKG